MVTGVAFAFFFGIRLLIELNQRETPADVNRTVDRSIARLISMWLFFSPVITISLINAADGSLIGMGVIVVSVVMLFPWLLATKVFVPLGWPRPAATMAWLAHSTWARDDKPAGSAIAAGLALLRQRGIPDPKAVERFQAKLERSMRSKSGKRPLLGSDVVAEAIMALASRRRERAEALFYCALSFDARTLAPCAERLAREWLAADAATRGDWQTILRVASSGSRSRATRLLLEIAGRLLGERKPSRIRNLSLWSRWIIAPARRRTRVLVLRALEAPSVPDSAYKQVITEADVSTLEEALTRSAQTLQLTSAQLSAEHVVRLAATWDATLASPGVVNTLLHAVARNEALGLDDPIATIREIIAGDLSWLIRNSRLPLLMADQHCDLLGQIAKTARETLIEEVELATERMGRRIKDKKGLPAIDELREWRTIANLYTEAVRRCGPTVRPLLFPTINYVAGNQAAWLYNRRAERPLANAIFRWLLAEAIAVNDDDAIKLLTKNAACTI